LSAARLSTALIALALIVGCGKTVPAGGVKSAPAPPPPARVEAPDLIPADLDLVIRLDLERMRAGLGHDEAARLSTQALDRAQLTGLARTALARAQVVWLGMRLSDLEAGDRVLAVRLMPKRKDDAAAPQRPPTARSDVQLEPDPIAFEPLQIGRANVRAYGAREEARRDGISLVVLAGERDVAFASPVQQQSVLRVLLEGPDEARGQPSAEGLLSLDYTARRIAAPLENSYPSLARVVGSIERIRATASLTGTELVLEARITCHDTRAAQRVERFIATFSEASASSEQVRAVLGSLGLSRNERTLIVRWPVPSELVFRLMIPPPTP